MPLGLTKLSGTGLGEKISVSFHFSFRRVGTATPSKVSYARIAKCIF